MNKPNQTYLRFPLARRIEHWVMMLCFTLLGVTGLLQRFPDNTIARTLLRVPNSIETLREIHHSAAIVMMFCAAWHLLVMGYNFFVLNEPLSMQPKLQDAKDGIQAFLYNIRVAKTYPKMGRYTFEEKMEYWAFVWGAIVMGVTGFMMWNPITATNFLPGEFVPAAKAAHGGEAVLAVLAIMIWHMYGVHIKRFNKAMFNGQISEEAMLHEHPLELEEIKSGNTHQAPNAQTIRKRQMIYYPIAGVLAIMMLAGIYGFVNSEATALETVQPLTETQIYTTPTP
ncbi:MAG: cytochrome b/b6 domain-containing protein [Chloroflexi bacterium]|nr:cytochrome b/b6 domain-containing protein [Chloroflexota bacterium]